jgi:hypothetical protein
MIFSMSKQVNEMPQTLQIKNKSISVTKLVLKMIISTIYQVTTKNKSALEIG